MIIATIQTVPGKRITQVLGLVRGNTIRARHLGHDIVAIMRNMAGGEVLEYTKLLAESREQSIDRMIEDAERLGANAVVGVHFATSMIMGAAAETMCYGTAVIITDE
jgi:uncharacterized protein YbjQ (UPF0145 family)